MPNKCGAIAVEEDGYRPESTRMTGTLSIELGLPDRGLCGNGYLGKFARARVVKAHREDARQAATAAMLAQRDPARRRALPQFPEGARVRVDAVVRRSPEWAARRLDDDNWWRGAKPLLDGFQDAGVVANDRQFVLGTVIWEAALPWRGGVIFTLTEVE